MTRSELRRLSALLIVLAICLRADTLSVTSQDNTNILACPSYLLSVQQFDPSLGQLNSMNYTFTDTQSIEWGWYDLNVRPGETFNVGFSGFTEATNDLALEIISSYQYTREFVTDGSHDSFTPMEMLNVLPAVSGSGIDPALIGTGLAFFPFSDQATVQSLSGPAEGVYASFYGEYDSPVLTVTYDYTPTPAPEPRGAAVVVLGCFLIGAFVRRQRRSRV